VSLSPDIRTKPISKHFKTPNKTSSLQWKKPLSASLRGDTTNTCRMLPPRLTLQLQLRRWKCQCQTPSSNATFSFYHRTVVRCAPSFAGGNVAPISDNQLRFRNISPSEISIERTQNRDRFFPPPEKSSTPELSCPASTTFKVAPSGEIDFF
jgi:hypothetical protein